MQRMTTMITSSTPKMTAPVVTPKPEPLPAADPRSASATEPILPRFGGASEPPKVAEKPSTTPGAGFDELLKPKAEPTSRPVSMAVTPQAKLAEQTLKNRETADFRMLSQINEEEEEEVVGNRDEITPEDDPSGYLQSLLDPAAPEAVKAPKGEEPTVALADDGYKSDESFGDEFYQTMHEEMLQKLLRKEGDPPQPERSGLKLEE